MLGEKLYDITGQVTGTRVLAGAGPNDVQMEVSFAGTGKLLGTTTIESGTYTATMKAPGALHAQGQGLSLTADGEAICWHGFGIGTPTGKGMAAKWRGAIHYSTPSQKYARLNTTAVVFEWDVDADGKCTGTTWEWK